MSDYEKLRNKIKESLLKKDSEIPEDIDLTVDENPAELPQPEEVTEFAPAKAEPEAEAPVIQEEKEEEEDESPLERIDEEVLIENAEDIIPATKEKKRYSMFRRSKEYVETPEGETETAEIRTFADRYARKNNSADDSAFGKFKSQNKNKFAAAQPHEVTSREAAVLEAAINDTAKKTETAEPVVSETKEVSAVEKLPSVAEMMQKQGLGNITKEIQANVRAESESIEEEEEEVKVFDKSEILSQLATADSGELCPEEIARIDEEVAQSIVNRSKSIDEKASEAEKTVEKRTFSNPFTAENLKNWRLRYDHLDSALNRSACKECTEPAELIDVKKTLSHERKILLIRAAVMTGLTLVTGLMNIITTASASAHNGKFGVFGGSNAAYGIVMLFMLLIGAGVMLPELRSGVYSLLKLKPKTATVLTCAYIAAFIQALWSVFTGHLIENEYHILVAAVLAVSIPVLIGKDYYFESFGMLLSHCEAGGNIGVLKDVESPVTVAEMLRDDASSGKTVRYPGLARFLEGMTASCADAPASSEIRGRIDAIFGAISILAGIIGAIGGHSIIFGLTALTACLCVSTPVASIIAGGRKIRDTNRVYSVAGIHISSFGDARQAVESENIVVNDDDIFTADIVDQIIIRQVSVPQASLIAAMLADKAGGVLARIFSAQIEENKDKFVPITEFTCENRLGVSGWLSDCKILLGNKTFMDNHSIQVPSDYIERNLDKNTQKLYLSINGSFVCCFALAYIPIAAVKKDLQNLVRQGTNLIILATDPNLTDDAIEKMLSFPADSVRVLSAGNLKEFCEARKIPVQSAKAGFSFKPGFAGFVAALGQAVKIDESGKLLNTVTIGGSAVGLVLSLIFALTGSKEGLSVWFAILMQVIVCALAFILPSKLSVPASKQGRIRPVKVNRQQPHAVDIPEKEDAEEDASEDEDYSAGGEPKPEPEPAPVYVAVNEMEYADYSDYSNSDNDCGEGDEEFEKLLEYMDKPQHVHTRIERKSFADRMSEKVKGFSERAKERRSNYENDEKPVDYYNSGNISTGEEYDFVGKYRGENMFSGLSEDN